LLATVGITFSLQARFAAQAPLDTTIRLVLAVFALLALLCPDKKIAAAGCVPVVLLIGYWLLRCRDASWSQEPGMVAAPVLARPAGTPLVDTERGRMQ
jgi:hypothetical protein